ncbi:MAG: response regulator [Xanthobacteraceae bacterium]
MSEIFIVDDDPSVRSALAVVLTGEGHQVTTFIEGEAFLSVARLRTPGCVLIDLHLPGCSGLDVLRKLDAHCYPAPILVISGHGDVPTAVDAIRNGALDFIEKPFDPAAVATRVREAIEAWQNVNREDSIFGRDFPGHDRLTGRELGISPRTIEVHRARIMEKLAAKNAADLMRIVLRGGRAGSERLSDRAI